MGGKVRMTSIVSKSHFYSQSTEESSASSKTAVGVAIEVGDPKVLGAAVGAKVGVGKSNSSEYTPRTFVS